MRIATQKIRLIAATLFLACVFVVVPSGSAQNQGNTLSINGMQLYYEAVGEGIRFSSCTTSGDAPRDGSPT